MDVVLGDTLTWAWPIILAGIALPLISLINGLAGWSTTKKKITVVAVSVFLAVVYVIASGLIAEVPESWSIIVTRVLVIAAIAMAVVLVLRAAHRRGKMLPPAGLREG